MKTASAVPSNTGLAHVPLAELVEFRRGLTYRKADEVAHSSNAVLRANNVDLSSGCLDLSDIRFISDEIEVPESKRLVPESLLICTASGSRSHLGKVAYIESETGYAFGGFMGLLVPSKRVTAKYLYYFLRSDAYQEFLASLSAGANINNLRFSDLGRLLVPVPNEVEQKRIVSILDQAFAALDRARAHAEANLADATELFDSGLASAFESHPDWPRKLLPEISENLDRQRVPITKKDRKPGLVPYYGASGVVDHVSDHIFDEDLLLVSEDGANLLARTYPIAFSISGKSWVNNHAHVLRFENPLDQEYVRLYLNSISLAPFVTGMAQPKLNQKSLNSIQIPFPDSAKRTDIVAQANTIREHCDGLAANYQSDLADIATLRQSLLQQAFSGQLV